MVWVWVGMVVAFTVGEWAGKSIVLVCVVVCGVFLLCCMELQWGGRGKIVEADLESVDTVFLSTHMSIGILRIDYGFGLEEIVLHVYIYNSRFHLSLFLYLCIKLSYEPYI